ncbi:protein winged eye-like isoform X4 [Nilaparvata lugens]|uniref:protein winged eye-like isoform X4 n=1 Tax=Nilaparvata lugens TaxID=108931 RepID=UPI00193CDD02|nr:protein winged eye-like isoform X4 [Nilaparvata lugens]
MDRRARPSLQVTSHSFSGRFFFLSLSSTSSSSHPHSSSSKKRRQMGRPKKRDENHHHHHHHHRDDSPSANVSKKARCSKNALVGLLLGPSAKNRLAQMATAQHSSSAPVTAATATNDANKPHKIRPKLKAEVKMKLWSEEEDGMEWTNISEESKMTSPLHMKFAHRRSSVPPENPLASPQQVTPVVSKSSGNGMRRPIKSKSLPGSIIQAKANKVAKDKQQAAPVMHKRKSLPAMPSTSNQKTSEISPKCISTLAELDTVECRLTLATLENEGGLPCRVLVAKGGLLYAGELAEIQAPDLYSITLDGERAHRPHIYTQEELLNDILLEVKLEIAPMQGTRLCAFWSQQYRCLYPGTVALHPSPHHHDLVCVEFDDGDNGRIPLDDLRLLPKGYPVVEYDPNPLLTLGKRKRRISTASSENSTKTNITAEQALEEIDEEHTDEPDEAMAEEEEPRQGGEDEDDEEGMEEHHEEEAAEVVNEQERMDAESDEDEEEGDRNSEENENGLMNRVEKESKDREINNGASGSGETHVANQPTVKTLTEEEEKERRRQKKKKREKHRMEMERRESGSGGEHKKKKKHRECCNKPHHHHKHKHHKHRHHKHRHSSADSSETNKEEGDENKMSPPKETDGTQTDRPHSKPLQADTTNTKEFKKHRDRQNSVEAGKARWPPSCLPSSFGSGWARAIRDREPRAVVAKSSTSQSIGKTKLSMLATVQFSCQLVDQIGPSSVV